MVTALASVVEHAVPHLNAISDDAASKKPAPNKWSKKEILGHLIDSAANNHQRFVRAQEAMELRLPGYAQEHWVAAQRYDQREWPEVIALWSAYNRHLAHVISHLPEDRRDVPCWIGDNPRVTLSHVAIVPANKKNNPPISQI